VSTTHVIIHEVSKPIVDNYIDIGDRFGIELIYELIYESVYEPYVYAFFSFYSCKH